MKKKMLALILCISMVGVLLVGCGKKDGSSSSDGSSLTKDNIKVGFIYVGDDSDQGYTSNFIDGTKEMMETIGLSSSQVIEKTNVSEDSACETALKELAEEGCNIIFATSFGFEDFVQQVAPDYPDIQFCHATGYQCASDDLDNTHNYFPQIYQARYLTGIIAGMTTKTNKLGYVAALPFSEVISGYTAFYLGAKSVNPNVTMEVQYTNTWNDANLEAQLAQALIDDGCDVLGQHCDSAAPATTAEKAGVWQIGYNTAMVDKAPAASLTSCRCDWGAYATYAVKCLLDGEEIAQDWSEGLNDDAVVITEYNSDLVTSDMIAAVDEAKEKILNGELNVFDTSTFTVGGKTMDSYENDFGVEFVKDGAFHEQDAAYGGSSPAWPSDWIVDGITVKE